MPIRGAQDFTFRAVGVSDADDATNAFAGCMLSLKDLIPNPANAQQYVPRPAATQITNFSGFTTPAGVTALLVVGTRAYGMISSSRFAGKDEPFCYDMAAAAFVTINGPTSANCPTTQPTTGDWVPPKMIMINKKIMITHPGYDGVNTFVGWIDLRSFTSTGATGDTHTNTTIDNLSSNPLTVLGWQVGDKVAGAGIPANTFIKSLTATSITLSQATTATAAGVALTVTSGTMAAPQYGAGQTNTVPLAAVPKSLEQFNGRAYYGVANTLQFSDALNPLQITLATQSLTLGDSTDVTCVAGMPLSNMIQGGVIQSLIVFKGAAPYWQVTGDPTTNNLSLNVVAGSMGTLAPNAVVGLPNQLGYFAPDGFRIIGPDGNASLPIGANGQGVNAPFHYAVNPSRMCAAYNQNIMRVSVQNGAISSQAVQEYWYDFTLNNWTGPHSFPASLIAPYYVQDGVFVLAAYGVNAKLWQSIIHPTASATYTENGVAMSWIWQSSLMPDNQQMAANQVIQTAVGMTMPETQSVNVLGLDEDGATLGNVVLSGVGVGGAIWGSFTWGVGVWGGSVANYKQLAVNWPNPLVFKQMSLRMTGASLPAFLIGNLYVQYQPTGYLGAH